MTSELRAQHRTPRILVTHTLIITRPGTVVGPLHSSFLSATLSRAPVKSSTAVVRNAARTVVALEPLIRSASLRGFAPLITALGGNPGSFLDRFGIPRGALDRDDGLVSITAHDLMLDAAAAELECPDLGLRLAEHQDLDILGPIAVAVAASSNGAEALRHAAEFMFVHSPVLAVEISPDPWHQRGVVALTYRKDVLQSPYSPQAIELGLGVFFHVGESLLAGAPGFHSVEIPHSPMAPVSRYTEFFGTDVKFNRPTAALRVDRRVLETSFATADDSVRSAAVDYLSARYSNPNHSAAHRTRLAIAEHLHSGAPALSTVASLLAQHPRTLQRQLAGEDTSYAVILDEVRRDTAYRYLTTTDLPLGQVASLVGFREQSALSHAVRRWYGISPRELRGGVTGAGTSIGPG